MTFIKKGIVVLSVVLVFVFLTGCIDYKAYDVAPQKEDDLDLLNEIAQIEEELNLVDTEEELVEMELVEEIEELEEELENVEEEEVVEEIVLPDLEEEVEVVERSDLQVITVDENNLVKLNVKVSDPDDDSVTYSFTPPLDDKGEWQTTYGDAGEYLVTLKATDGFNTIEKKITIVVNRLNAPPVIGLLEDIRITEGETVSFEPEVSDPNGDPISVTLSEPLKNGIFVADHTSAGEYLIKVVASDGELETEETFKLVIEDVNELPVMSNLGDITVNEGEIVKIEPEVSDLDRDEITLTISEPVGDDGVWETGYTDHGEYFVTVIASDGKDSVTEKIKIVVVDVNMPPEFVDVSLAVN